MADGKEMSNKRGLKLIEALENSLLPIMEKLSNLSYLAAIRSALVVTLPLVFMGSIAELINSFPLPAYREFMTATFGENWRAFSTAIVNGTFSIMALIVLFSIGQRLAEQHNTKKPLEQVSPVIAALLSIACFFTMVPVEGGLFPQRWLGVSGLFLAILTSVAATSFFIWLHSFKKLRLYLPGGTTESSVPQAFNALLPGMITIGFFAAFATIINAATGLSMPEIIHNLIRAPFDLLRDGIQRGMVYIASLQGLWFFGIHGANVLDPITHDIYGLAMTENALAYAAGLPPPHIMTKVFMDAFVFMGGSGSSLCLILALLIFGRSAAFRKLGLMSIGPGLFNINEIIIYGLPVVLNPVMLIPFIMTPLVLATTGYAATAIGLVPATMATVEWTTPIFLSGYMCTNSIAGSFLQLFNLILGTVIYAPFVILANRVQEKGVQKSLHTLMLRAVSVAAGPSGQRLLDYQDEAGALARGLLTDLEYAIKSGTGLQMVYHPQVGAQSGRVTGTEALLRWKHPVHGWIPAPITVGLAEDSGLIQPLGLWIFETSCATRRRWLDLGVDDLCMSINVSALQLKPELVGQFMDVMRKYDLAPEHITIEITESAALEDGRPESRILADLNANGMHIAIDDFGMGHSSLSYLRQFPVNEVKIDGSIVKEVETNPICRDIVASITRLCQARDMISVAEYVETREQADILRSLNCDVFQGYLYSMPLPDEQCLIYIKRNHAQIAAEQKSATETKIED